MIVNVQVGKSSPKARVEYLLYGVDGTRDPSTVEVLYGNADLFIALAEGNQYKRKTYNILISFKESREELERKLAEQGKTIEELFQEIFSFFQVGYSPEDLNVFAVAHSDTDNFHIHLTIENKHYGMGKALYFPRTKKELEYYRFMEKYINLKYNLSVSNPSSLNRGRAGLQKIKQILEERGTYKNKTRDEVKEEITNLLLQYIGVGLINSGCNSYLKT